MLKSESCIYIIDDNESVCNSLRFLLEMFYEIPIKCFYDPLQFLNNIDDDSSGCIIVDLSMPAMDGIELIHVLKKQQRDIPIIIMSGHADCGIAEQAMQAGAYGFITKPFKIEELLPKIQQMP